MKTLKSAASSTKNHIVRNRAKYAVAGTTIVFLGIMYRNGQEWIAFLEEHCIDPHEFLNPEALAESIA